MAKPKNKETKSMIIPLRDISCKAIYSKKQAGFNVYRLFPRLLFRGNREIFGEVTKNVV